MNPLDATTVSPPTESSSPSPPVRVSTAAAYAPFVVSAIVSAVVQWSRWPSLFRSGEMWAEAATNYFYHAHFSDLGTNLQTIDYAYSPLLARLCALVVEALGASPATTPWVYQWLALGGISLCTATFSLPTFRRWIEWDVARMIVSISLAFHGDYDLKAFINFPYWGAIPFFLLLVELPVRERISTRTIIGTSSLMVLLCLSKPHFVTFAPALAVWLVCELRAREWRRCIIPAVTLIATAVQIGVMLSHPQANADALRQPLGTVLRHAIETSIGVFRSTILGQWHLLGRPLRLHSWLAMLGFGAAAIGFFRARSIVRDRSIQWMVVVASLTIGCGCLLVAKTYPDFLPQRDSLVWDRSLLQLRWYFVPAVACFFAVAIVISRGFRGSRSASFALAAFGFVSFPFGLRPLPRDSAWPTTHFSEWQTLAPLVLGRPMPEGCIPINPYPWYVGFGQCSQLSTPPPPQHAVSDRTDVSNGPLAAPREGARWHVESVAIAMPRPPAPTARLVARSADGDIVGTASIAGPAEGPFHVFVFARPTSGIATIELDPAAAPSITLDPNGAPVWIWYGRVR